MFGYVRPALPELRLHEYGTYRAYYCGICKELGRQCGPFCRAFLRYDFVLLALALDAAFETDARAVPCRCPLLPLRRRNMMRTEAVAYASDAHGLLLLVKSLDDRSDGGGMGLLAKPLGALTRKAARRRPELMEAMTRMLERQREAEREDAGHDSASEPFAAFCAAMFAPPEVPKRHAETLRWLGRNVGRWIYLADALDDFDRDEKRGGYNALLGAPREQAAESVLPEMNLCAQEALAAYELLPPHRHAQIVRNILEDGLFDVAEAIATKTLDKRGGIEGSHRR
jgi:hypothetical protein